MEWYSRTNQYNLTKQKPADDVFTVKLSWALSEVTRLDDIYDMVRCACHHIAADLYAICSLQREDRSLSDRSLCPAQAAARLPATSLPPCLHRAAVVMAMRVTLQEHSRDFEGIEFHTIYEDSVDPPRVQKQLKAARTMAARTMPAQEVNRWPGR